MVADSRVSNTVPGRRMENAGQGVELYRVPCAHPDAEASIPKSVEYFAFYAVQR
jgi:hypothetical protein